MKSFNQFLQESYLNEEPAGRPATRRSGGPTPEEVKAEILELDEAGKLCDGSLVNPKRFKKGKKLKQRLVNRKELIKHFTI